MKLLCSLVGHRPGFGYGRREGQGYFRIQSCYTDGIGRVHADLYTDCERCGEHYQVGKVHLPPVNKCQNRE